MTTPPSIFATIKNKMRWLAQRQQIITENIVNARKPGYLPRDLKPLKQQKTFSGLLHMDKTKGNHLDMQNAQKMDMALEFESQLDFDPRDLSHAGNAVVTEKEMMKSSDTGIQYKEAGAAYEKFAKMRKLALGKK